MIDAVSKVLAVDDERGPAVIVNAYSYRNAGDAAIMISTATLLQNMGFSKILLSTRYSEDAESYRRHDVEVVLPLIPFAERNGRGGSASRGLEFLLCSILAVVFLSLPRVVRAKPIMTRLMHRRLPALAILTPESTAVIAGGGYLYSSKRLINLSFLHSLMTVWVARRMAREVMVMPASIGPIHRKMDRFLVELACRSMTMVLRESISIDAGRYAPRLSKTVMCPDVAFYGSRETEKLASNADRRKIVRMVAMDWTWSKSVSADAMNEYLNAMASVADRLNEDGFLVEIGGHSVIPEHGQDDLLVCDEIAARSKFELTVDRNADVEHLWRRYSEVKVVLGTRLHACIMAVSVGTPAVVLAYQEKSLGVMDTAGVPADVFKVDDLDVSKLVAACVEAASEDAQEAVAVSRSIARSRIEDVLGA